MTRAVRPEGGHPWEQPGFEFSIGWPYGYTPIAAAEAVAAKRGKAALQSAAATKAREAAAITGKGWGKGTIAGMGKA